MYIVFFSTTNVFEAEDKLNKAKVACNVVPTPVSDKAYCGVCIETENSKAVYVLEGMEFNVVE